MARKQEKQLNLKSNQNLIPTKKSLINEILKKRLELEFEENHSIKSKSLKFILKKNFPQSKTWSKKQEQSKKVKFCCRNFTDNVNRNRATRKNKVIREKLRTISKRIIKQFRS